MLEQIYLQRGGTGASACTEFVQGVIKMDCCHEADIQEAYHSLPEDLNQPNSAEVDVTLWYQDKGLSGALLHKVTLTESHLDQ